MRYDYSYHRTVQDDPAERGTAMSYQTQKQPAGAPLFSETETPEQKEKEQRSPAKKRGGRILRIAAIAGVCALCFAAGTLVRNRNGDPYTMPAEPGYLSLPEYVLVPADSAEPVTKKDIVEFTNQSTFLHAYRPYKTSRGILPGMTWEEFVEAYGDTYIYEAVCDKEVLVSQGTMTVSEFSSQYAEKILADPDVFDFKVTFMTGTDGTALYYTDTQLVRAVDEYENTSDLIRPLHNKRPSRYEMQFRFERDGDGLLVEMYSVRMPEY